MPATLPVSTSTVPGPPEHLGSVTFLLTGSSRCNTMHGGDFQAQVLFLILDGLSIQRIAATLGCDDSIITRLINGWQATLEGNQLPGWEPRTRNPRRVKDAAKLARAAQNTPSPKII